MADWCPSPEKRNIIVGVCVTLNYAVDSFANSASFPHLFVLSCRVVSRHVVSCR